MVRNRSRIVADSTFAGIEFTFSYLEPVRGDRTDPPEGWTIEDIVITDVDKQELTVYLNAGHSLDIETLRDAAVRSLEPQHDD